VELAKLQRERAVDSVYQQLRKAIIGSLFKPGERLKVDELAAKLGVSLTPVRSAVQQLANEGLVEIRPRSGTFVAMLTAQDVVETFKIRCALECLAAEEALPRLTSRDVQKMRDLQLSMKDNVHSGEDRKSHDRDNSELHLMIVQAAGNRRLEEMYGALKAHLNIASIHASELNWTSRLAEEQAEHEAIISAVEQMDLAALTAALRRHIYRAMDSMVESLNARAARDLQDAGGSSD
jgi:DNA-binding GntR family transcriptional regulator